MFSLAAFAGLFSFAFALTALFRRLLGLTEFFDELLQAAHAFNLFELLGGKGALEFAAEKFVGDQGLEKPL